MSIWAWIQPVDRIWKVVTDSEKGVIKICNEKDELVFEQKDLGKDEVIMIEDSFLSVVATRLTIGSAIVEQKIDGVSAAVTVNKHEYDSMFA